MHVQPWSVQYSKLLMEIASDRVVFKPSHGEGIGNKPTNLVAVTCKNILNLDYPSFTDTGSGSLCSLGLNSAMHCEQGSLCLPGLVACSGSCARTAGAREAGEATARNTPPYRDLQWDAGGHAAEGAVVEVQLRLIDLPVFRVCCGAKDYQTQMQTVVCSHCSQHIDAQKELLEELYEDKLNNLKESLTDYYQEEIQVCSEGWNDIRKVAGTWEYLSPGRRCYTDWK